MIRPAQSGQSARPSESLDRQPLSHDTVISRERERESSLVKREAQLRNHIRVLGRLAQSRVAMRGELPSAVRELTEAAAATLDVERASVWLFDDEHAQIECFDLYTFSASTHAQGDVIRARDYPAYFAALETDRAIVADDAHTDPRTREFSAPYLRPLNIWSMLDAPIRVYGRMVGVVCHEHVGGPRQWTAEEEMFAASMADLVSLAIEASDRKEAEDELKRLLAELSHRVKNTLATVLSIATQTIRRSDSLEAFQATFEGRIHALARAHRLLSASRWQGASLTSLVDHALRPHASPDGSNIAIQGPDVLLWPRGALVMSMVVHELTTNAAKYGALSVPRGRVRVRWRVADQRDGTRRLRLAWVESGLRDVRPPSQRGFGTDLIEQSIAFELKGRAKLDYRTNGVHCRIEFSLNGAED